MLSKRKTILSYNYYCITVEKYSIKILQSKLTREELIEDSADAPGFANPKKIYKICTQLQIQKDFSARIR